MGYTWHLKVPAHYVDYYCGISDLPPAAILKADEWLAEHVTTPHTDAWSDLYKGSAQTWPDGDGNWSYIYSKDWNTWPADQPTPESYVAPARKVSTMTQEQSDAYQAKLKSDIENSGGHKVAEVNRLERLLSSTKTYLRENPGPEAEAAHAEAIQDHQKAHQALQDHVAATQSS
jgi:hypothetical protein